MGMPAEKTLSPTLRAVLSMLEAGQSDQAILYLRENTAKASRNHGQDSLEHANALEELGWCHWWTEDYANSFRRFDEALSILGKGDSQEFVQAHSKLFLQKALLHAQNGDINNAIHLLEEKCNGSTNPNPELLFHVANFHLMLGKPELAQAWIQKYFMTGNRNPSPIHDSALILKAEICRSLPKPEKCFPDGLPADIDQASLVQSAVAKTTESDPVILLEVLEELYALVLDEESKNRILAEKANLFSVLGRHDDRISLIKQQESTVNTKSPFDLAYFQMAYGLAFAESFRLNEAMDCYRKALEALENESTNQYRHHARMQLAMVLDQMGRHLDGASMAEMAANDAFEIQHHAGGFRSLGIQGICLLHAGQPEKAYTKLRQALENLSPNDPYAKLVIEHWDYHQDSKDCGCKNPDKRHLENIRFKILQACPRGYLRNVIVHKDQDGYDLEFDFARNPSEETMASIRQIAESFLD